METNSKTTPDIKDSVPEKLSKWAPKILLKSLKMRPWIPTCPSCCSQGRPGCPQDAKIALNGAKMEAPGLPNHGLGHQKMITIFFFGHKIALRTDTQKPASQHTFQQRDLMKKQTSENNNAISHQTDRNLKS